MSQKSTLRELDNGSFLSPQALASPREETDQFTLPSGAYISVELLSTYLFRNQTIYETNF